LADKLKLAYNRKYLDPQTHTYQGTTQTGYMLALAFGLEPEEQRDAIVANLVDDIMVKHNGHLSGGLIGMQWLMQTLTEIGHPMSHGPSQRRPPSQLGLHAFKRFNTIWERWDYERAIRA